MTSRQHPALREIIGRAGEQKVTQHSWLRIEYDVMSALQLLSKRLFCIPLLNAANYVLVAHSLCNPLRGL